VLIGDDVTDAQPSARSQDPERLCQNAGLVRGQADDAVGDDYVDGVSGERDVFDVA
jgi:hypothetical protein